MKQIKKKDLKEVIRLTKLWYDFDNDDVSYQELYQATLKAFGNGYEPYQVVQSILSLKSRTPLKAFYKIFEALGYELV